MEINNFVLKILSGSEDVVCGIKYNEPKRWVLLNKIVKTMNNKSIRYQVIFKPLTKQLSFLTLHHRVKNNEKISMECHNQRLEPSSVPRGREENKKPQNVDTLKDWNHYFEVSSSDEKQLRLM